MQTEKPRATKGTKCPLWKKDVSQVCHTCAWWRSTPAEQLQPNGALPRMFEYWDCAITMQTKIMRDIGVEVNGVQRATESFRNEVAERSDAGIMNALVKLSDDAQRLNGDNRQQLEHKKEDT